MQQLGLTDVADTRIGSSDARGLSGGEMRRVSIGLELIAAPDVLVLDEPTSGMDAASQAKVLEAIARLRGQRTVILVTHRPEPLAVADRVIRLAPTGAE